MNSNKSIAIIGMSCRFPGADNPASFWELLRDGKNMISEIGDDRWDLKTFYNSDPTTPNRSYQRHGAFLDKIHHFDPLLFNISPAEAIEMAPSQKLMLELTWEAIEQSGLPYDQVTNEKVGVYVGNIWNDFEHLRKHLNANTTSHSAMGQSTNIIANRVSYSFGFTGPSLSVDTGCSSSLVALHLACQSLWDNSTKMCVVGGINHILDQDQYVLLSKFGGLSKKGQCSAFSATGDGFVRSEGAGLVLLKRLEDAEKDGDNIIAVVKGSAMNNNGYNVNLPATSSQGQIAMLEEAYKDSGVNPAEVQYVEAHGTGTKLGDPTEAKALGTFFSKNRSKNNPLKIGSVKTNIGHLEGAAGIAGLIKVLVSLQYKQIPASLNFDSPNPEIPFEELKLQVNNNLTDWKTEQKPRVAGVNSFGWGGTNAHTVIEEYIPKNKTEDKAIFESHGFLLMLSAKNEKSLKEYTRKYIELIGNASTQQQVYDICIATATNKPLLEHRISISGSNREELLLKLNDFIKEDNTTLAALGEQRKVVFVFPGQGSQWLGMGREFYYNEPIFKQEIDNCELAFSKYVDWSLTGQIFADKEKSRLHEIDVIQPFLFAVEVALAKLWMHKGIKPDAVIGHSMGEVASAYISGTLHLNDAANIICSRSKLMKTVSGQGGAMAVTELSVVQAEKVIAKYEGALSVAVSNSPKSSVIAGEESKLLKVLEELEAQGLFCKQVKVDVASHSPQMDSLITPLMKKLQGLSPESNSIPFYSTVEGREIPGITLDEQYWTNNLRGMVQFSTTIGELIASDHRVFIEMSPHPVLTNAITECAGTKNVKVAAIASLFREKPENISFLSNAGKLFEHGFHVNWKQFFGLSNTPNIVLPSYPMDKRDYSLEDRSALKNHSSNIINPLLGRRVVLAGIEDTFIWENKLTLEQLPFVKDHKVNDTAVLPGVSYLEILYAALRDVFGNGFHQVKSLKFNSPVFLEEHDTIDAQLKIVRLSPQTAKFFYYIASEKGGEIEWTECAYGDLYICGSREKVSDDYLYELKRKHGDIVINKEEFYKVTDSIGIKYGNLFQGINWISVNEEQAIAHVVPDALIEQYENDYFIHPAVLDSCFQTIFTPVRELGEKESHYTTYLSNLKGFRWFRKPEKGDSILVKAQNKGKEKDHNGFIRQRVSLDIYDVSGNFLADLETLEAIIIDNKELQEEEGNASDWLMNIHWEKFDIPAEKREACQGAWIAFEDHLGVVQKLDRTMRRDNRPMIKIGPGDDFLRIDQHEYLVNYKKPESLKKLFIALIESNIKIDGIIHAASLNDHIQYNDLDAGTLETIQYDGSILLKNLHKALLDIKDHNVAPRLFVLTNGLHAFSNKHMNLNIAQAPMWGMAKVLFNESPDYQCTRFDMSFFPEDAEVETLYELLCCNDLGSSLLIRNREVFKSMLEKENKPLSNISNGAFDQEGAFIVTGFRGMAFKLVEWLIDKGVKNIALVSRSGAMSNEVATKIEEYNALGNQLKIYKTDVSDYNYLADTFKLIETELGAIKGIIHAAGVIKPNTVLDLDTNEYLDILAPKMKGTWNLHLLSLTRNIEHFILCSSASTFIGLSGQASYVAANSFLDSFAHYRKKRNLTATTINWGVIEDFGMVADEENIKKYALAEGFQPFEMEKGVKVFDKIYSANLVQVGINQMDFKKTAEYYGRLASTGYFNKLIAIDETEYETQQLPNLREMNYEDALLLLESKIKSKVTAITKTPSDMITSTSTFKGLGMDSLMAVQLRRQLEKQLDIKIMPNSFWKYPSMRAFAAFALEAINEKIAETNLWWNSIAKQSPETILYCFHDAGGSSSMYLNWENLDQTIELRAIELPGRGVRSDENPAKDFKALAEEISLEIAQNSNGLPYIFFGHSMGGALAFETVRALKRQNLQLPMMLFTSSTPALFSYDKKAYNHKVTEAELVKKYPHLSEEKLKDNGLRKELIKMMRADLELLDSYNYQADTTLDLPIVSLRGIEDDSVTLEQIKKWKAETTAEHEYLERSGGHRYIENDATFLSELINSKLSKLVNQIKI